MTYQGQDPVKADVLTIPKMWYFLRFEGFEPELLAVKVGSIFDIDDVLELSVKTWKTRETKK